MEQQEMNKMVEELNEEHSFGIVISQKSNTIFDLEFTNRFFINNQKLCSIQIKNQKFYIDKLVSFDSILEVKLAINSFIEIMFLEKLTKIRVIYKIIHNYFDYMIQTIRGHSDVNLVIVNIHTNDEDKFNLIVDTTNGNVTAQSEEDETISVTNTPSNIALIDQTIKETIEQLLMIISNKTDVKLPDPAIIKDIQKSLHKYRNKGIEQILSFRGSFIMINIFYSYLISKYKSDCFRPEISPQFDIDNDGDLSEQQINSAHYVSDCISNNAEMLIIPISINSDEEGNHSNILIYRKKFHTIEHFEPNGGSHPYNSDALLTNFNEQMTSYIFEINKELDPAVNYVHSSKICPGKGFQAFEADSTIPLLLPNEPRGYCILWSMFFTEICLKNPDKTSDELIRYIFKSLPRDDKTENVLRKICQGYVHVVYDKINKYVAKHFPTIQLHKGMTPDEYQNIFLQLYKVVDINLNNHKIKNPKIKINLKEMFKDAVDSPNSDSFPSLKAVISPNANAIAKAVLKKRHFNLKKYPTTRYKRTTSKKSKTRKVFCK